MLSWPGSWNIIEELRVQASLLSSLFLKVKALC